MKFHPLEFITMFVALSVAWMHEWEAAQFFVLLAIHLRLVNK